MSFLNGSNERRIQAFQQLKPICVGISQATVALQGSRGNIAELTSRLETLDKAVKSVLVIDLLDEKLADYIFFPLSQVLKLSQRMSIRCLELTLSIFPVLIDRGWQQHLQPQLATQMLILCTLLAGNKPIGLSSSETTVELRASALRCLRALFQRLQVSKAGRTLLQGDGNMLQLGQMLSTILDAIVEVDDLATQCAAIDSLGGLIRCLDDSEIVARFLPGIISGMTKVLTPKARQRRARQVLVGCLCVVTGLIAKIFSDKINDKRTLEGPMIGASSDDEQARFIDDKWLEAAATQMKPALVSIFRLKHHDNEHVREVLAQLCITLVEHCSRTLASCTPVALDTLITIDVLTESKSESVNLPLLMILSADAMTSTMLQELLHDWLQSMPRVMQSSDEEAKIERLRKLHAAYHLLAQSGAPMQRLHMELAHTLRDSMIVMVQPDRNSAIQAQTIKPVQSLELTVLADDKMMVDYTPVFSGSKHEQATVSSIESLVGLMSQYTAASAALAEIARSLPSSKGNTRLVDFWLLYMSTKAAVEHAGEADDLLSVRGDENAGAQDALEELYAFSLSVLNEATETSPDTRMQALALRGLALRAQAAGKTFRYELVDALYPVLHTLATPDTQLQQDSITTLNIFTQACAYSSTQDLIVSNVDYLTNAVALKLNAFDVSPQAPQVLLMMVRLAGPSLLPYLEDTIESIFAALEDFHGYPTLVELLFRVLGVVAEEGAKAPQLAIANQPEGGAILYESTAMKPVTIPTLADLLRDKVKDDIACEANRGVDDKQHSAPKRPWAIVGDRVDAQTEEDMDNSEGDQQVSDETPPPPAPKTYKLLVKITELTQHFLPSASPSLRTSLMALIHTTAPALAKHEDSFLPLINALWPEVTARLDDNETHVQAAALHIISDLCENAKDFMRSRIVELWPILLEVHQRVSKEIVALATPNHQEAEKRGVHQRSDALVKNDVKFRQAVSRMQASPSDYSNTSLRLLWEALVKMITTAVRFVALPPEKVDDALRMLVPALGQRNVREAFQHGNVDALWLVDMRSGVICVEVEPTVPPGKRWRWAAVPG